MDNVNTDEWWQITDFAIKISEILQEKYNDEKAGFHYNTVDKWFKALESKRIHYVNRAAGEKIYDKLDLEIGLFIAEARKDNRFRLDVIYEKIPDNFPVRPFPEEFEGGSTGLDETLLQRRIMENITKLLAQQFNMHEEKLEMNINKMISTHVKEQMKNLLPEPESEEEKRVKSMDENLTRIRIELQLEDEAIKEWNKLPEGERTKKAGLFRREEDLIKRDKFIRTYKKDHIEEKLKEEYLR